MMMTSLGVIETRGLTSAIQAADAACKSAAVNLVGYKKIGSGLVSVMFHGEISAISAAVENGVEATKDVVASLVIARPDESVLAMLENEVCPQPDLVTEAAPEVDSAAETARSDGAEPTNKAVSEAAKEAETKPEAKPEAKPVDVDEVKADQAKADHADADVVEVKVAANKAEEKPVATNHEATAVQSGSATRTSGDKPAAKRSTRTRRQGTRQ
ncbi:BMC domain-containing protein [Photobacterium sp. MCCC 1A19761]|uniref:BMC domain-containing protein n=1 Tax=Photobacterium sp. MCCC 1A19761 TaxID=3115000 RepID=UPI003FCDC43C